MRLVILTQFSYDYQRYDFQYDFQKMFLIVDLLIQYEVFLGVDI
jgi:hypothetical protein